MWTNLAAFSEKLAKVADLYVNDAFGTAHRAHATTEGVAHLVKPAVSGFLMEQELRYLGDALAHEAGRDQRAVLVGHIFPDKEKIELHPGPNTARQPAIELRPLLQDFMEQGGLVEVGQ